MKQNTMKQNTMKKNTLRPSFQIAGRMLASLISAPS